MNQTEAYQVMLVANAFFILAFVLGGIVIGLFVEDSIEGILEHRRKKKRDKKVTTGNKQSIHDDHSNSTPP